MELRNILLKRNIWLEPIQCNSGCCVRLVIGEDVDVTLSDEEAAYIVRKLATYLKEQEDMAT